MFTSAILTWMDRLSDKKVFDGMSSVLELGPQDLLMGYECSKKWLGGFEGGQALLDAMYDRDGKQNQSALGKVYHKYGLYAYESLDLHDMRADLVLDLNVPVSTKKKYDLISNFGTLEHCFNIGVAFANIHNLLNKNGVFISVMPVMGDFDHGFYSINPVLYTRLARVNEYEVIDLLYVPNCYGLHRDICNASGHEAKSLFEENVMDLNIGYDDHQLKQSTTIEFAKKAMEERDGPVRCESYTYDYCYVALRKTSEKEFVFPQQ